MISGSRATEFLSMICNSNVVHGHYRFQGELWKLFPVLVSRSIGSQFPLMIYDSDVIHGRWRYQRHRGSGIGGWFLDLLGLSLNQYLRLWRSLEALKISATPRFWFPVMISRSPWTQFSSMIYDSDVVHGRCRFKRHRGSGSRGWFLGLEGRSFR